MTLLFTYLVILTLIAISQGFGGDICTILIPNNSVSLILIAWMINFVVLALTRIIITFSTIVFVNSVWKYVLWASVSL